MYFFFPSTVNTFFYYCAFVKIQSTQGKIKRLLVVLLVLPPPSGINVYKIKLKIIKIILRLLSLIYIKNYWTLTLLFLSLIFFNAFTILGEFKFKCSRAFGLRMRGTLKKKILNSDTFIYSFIFQFFYFKTFKNL